MFLSVLNNVSVPNKVLKYFKISFGTSMVSPQDNSLKNDPPSWISVTFGSWHEIEKKMPQERK